MKRIFISLLVCVSCLAAGGGKKNMFEKNIPSEVVECKDAEEVFRRYDRKIWIPYKWEQGKGYGNDAEPFAFYLYREGENIVGNLFSTIPVPPCDSYESITKPGYKRTNLSGTVIGDKIECHADADAYNGIFCCQLCEDGMMEVQLKSSGESLLFRPYVVADMKYTNEEWETVELELNSWGKVNLKYGSSGGDKSHPIVVLAGMKDEIYYYFDLSFPTASEIENIIVEDSNGDGLLDIKVTACFSEDTKLEFERVFYQMDNGLFYYYRDAGVGMTVTNAMEQYYGYYEIAEFYFSRYFPNYDDCTRQEADMMLGRIIKLQPEQIVTWDCTRRLDYFQGNFSIKKVEISEPELEWISIENTKHDSDSSDFWWWLNGLGTPYEVGQMNIDGVIILPELFESIGTQGLYTLSDDDSLVLLSQRTNGFYRLEKLDYDASEQLREANGLSRREIRETMDSLYGTCRVTGFLPTKFYPAQDSSGDAMLPQEEADMMLGKEIQIGKSLFTVYDNGRLPNSNALGRAMDDFVLEEVRIEEPEYCVKMQKKEDIYGLRDDMLPEELVRRQYIEVSVYPGYRAGNEMYYDMVLPQLYVIDGNTVLLYCMCEYFILEKTED